MFDWFKKRQATHDRVLVLVDFDNIAKGLRGVGRDFPTEEIKSLGRQYGMPQPPKVFVSHLIPQSVMMVLRRQGFRLILCPPAKFGGPDTVDETIQEVCEEFAGNPEFTTFVVVSTDGDFYKTEDFLLNHHKKVFRYKLDEFAATLSSSNGDVVHLLNTNAKPKEENPFAVSNAFMTIIQRMATGQAVNAFDVKRAGFVWQVVEACADIHVAEQRRNGNRIQRGFKQRLELIWQYLYPMVFREFAIQDCHNVLDGLLKCTNVLLRREQETPPRTYYTYNPNHTFRSQ